MHEQKISVVKVVKLLIDRAKRSKAHSVVVCNAWSLDFLCVHVSFARMKDTESNFVHTDF